MNIENINSRFNEELQQQINGLLPKAHTYQLGTPAAILRSANIPDLPIELRASRLIDKSMQETHPFDLYEVMNLPKAMQAPLAIFRSATHIGSYVIMTELEHKGRNYITALDTHKRLGTLGVNSIRSIYPKNNKQVLNWIVEELLDYTDKQRMIEWITKQRYNSADVRKPFNHTFNSPKQQSNSADVRKLLNSAAKIVQNFENAKF